jgi:hypothetical protein
VALLAVVPTALVVFVLESSRGSCSTSSTTAVRERVRAGAGVGLAMALAGGATVHHQHDAGGEPERVGALGLAGVDRGLRTSCLSVAVSGWAAAWAMLLVQGVVLMLVSEHARRMFAAGRGAAGSVLILNWRDVHHPQGGGSEVFVERSPGASRPGGRKVTVFCGAYEGAARDECGGGVGSCGAVRGGRSICGRRRTT